MSLSRRELLGWTLTGTGAVAFGNIGTVLAGSPAAAAGFGEPVADPAGILDLPSGFTYRIVSRAGDPLPGGGITPGRHDGTASFVGATSGLQLVQNHEIGASDPNPALAVPELTYDPKSFGGTTTLSLDNHLNRIDEYVSLAGTSTNCAGGLTPWATWLTCEETETLAGAAADKDHGFVFEVDPANPSNNVSPTPLQALGRFAHEAVVVDPYRGDLYLTEDANSPNGLVFRFSPTDRSQSYGALRAGGSLAAMSCSRRRTHVADLSVFSTPGTTLDVAWISVPDPQATTVSIRKQFADTEVTRSRKFEGAWWGDASGHGHGRRDGHGHTRGRSGDNGHGRGGENGHGHGHRRGDRSGEMAHIVCSFARLSDGSFAEHDGQVWGYDPERQTLTLELYLPVNPDPNSDIPDGPDNISVSPYGGFFLAEDGLGAQHLLAVDEDGDVRPFAWNRLSSSEFTGVNFSPGGRVLFANLQDQGLCFAITGPFHKLG